MRDSYLVVDRLAMIIYIIYAIEKGEAKFYASETTRTHELNANIETANFDF